jgi:hypothetical protein
METGPSALPELGRGDIGPIAKRFVRRIDQLQLRFLLLVNIVSLNIIVACANAKGNPRPRKFKHPQGGWTFILGRIVTKSSWRPSADLGCKTIVGKGVSAGAVIADGADAKNL